MATGNKYTAAIVADRGDRTLSYAADDLRALLESTGQVSFVDSGAVWTFELAVDASLAPTSFAVYCPDGGNAVRLTGSDAACVLCSVYTALEQTGFLFDITGQTPPEKLELEKLRGWSTVVVPAVKRRGIRQHINFCMDISSYPIEEAREYVRNLARLRMKPHPPSTPIPDSGMR